MNKLRHSGFKSTHLKLLGAERAAGEEFTVGTGPQTGLLVFDRVGRGMTGARRRPERDATTCGTASGLAAIQRLFRPQRLSQVITAQHV